MITLKKSSGSQSGMRMKATPRAAKKKKRKMKATHYPNALSLPPQKFKWIIKPVHCLQVDFRPTAHSTNLQSELWVLLRSLRLLFCTAKFQTDGVDFSLPALI